MEIVEFNPKKWIYRVPNNHNLYFKLKSNKFIRRIKLNKFFTLFEQFIKWTKLKSFDNERGIYYQAKEKLNEKKYDFIITSGEPFILFKYAKSLKEQFNVKIALDYRDGWSTNSQRNSSKRLLQKIILLNEKRIEKKIIRQADILLFTSQTLKKEIIKSFCLDENKIPLKVINNGIKFINNTGKNTKYLSKKNFNISFIGSLYHDHNIELFLDALNDLIVKYKCEKIKVYFVGSMLNCPDKHKFKIKEFKKKYNNNIDFIEYVNNEDAIRIQFESTILLKFNSFEQRKGHFGKKLYEYAFSGKKVLAIDKKTGFNHKLDFFDDRPFVYNFNVKEQITAQILSFYKKWQNNEPLLNGIKMEELIPYSTKNQTKLLEQILFSYLN